MHVCMTAIFVLAIQIYKHPDSWQAQADLAVSWATMTTCPSEKPRVTDLNLCATSLSHT